MPKSIANIEAIAQKRKADEYAQVPLPDKIPVGTNQALAAQESTCEQMLK